MCSTQGFGISIDYTLFKVVKTMTVFPYAVMIIAVIVDFTIFCLVIFVLAYLSS